MPEVYDHIDLSYKDDAVKCEYDIESLESLFSIVFMNDESVTIVFFGDDTYNNVTDDELRDVARRFMSGTHHLDTFKDANDVDDIDYHVVRAYTGDKNSLYNLSRLCMKFSNCKPLPCHRKYGHTFVEYCGWNSARYDLPLMIIVQLLIENMGDRLTPADIRRASDVIINYDGSPWGFPYELERATKGWGNITHQQYRLLLNSAIYADGHIDWASTAKLGDEGSEQKFPPGLKKEMARYGMDIVIDDLVGGQQSPSISKQDVLDLIYYNCNDVLGTRIIGRNVRLQAKLQAHDTLNRLYPYTSARSVEFDKLKRVTPLARDCTEASLSGTILIGPKRIRPVDAEGVTYEFPVPDHDADDEGATKTVNLLEYMKQTEEYMHPFIYDFFKYFENKDTRRGYDEWKVIKAQPITHATTMNCPYYRDGKPVNSYIREIGRAHV